MIFNSLSYKTIQMLSEVLKKYEHTKKTNQKNIETLHDQIQQDIQATTIRALKLQNYKITKIHSNQQVIEGKLKRNAQLQNQMKMHVDMWVGIYNELNNALKDAGDIVHYARYVEEEIKQMADELKSRADKETIKQEQEQTQKYAKEKQPLQEPSQEKIQQKQNTKTEIKEQTKQMEENKKCKEQISDDDDL